MHKKGPAAKGTTPPGQVASGTQRLIGDYLAVGALEAAIEDVGTHFALVLALEQRPVAMLIAPAMPRLFGGAAKDHAIAVDPVDVGAAQRMVRTAALGVRLGQDQPIACDAVDGPDMLEPYLATAVILAACGIGLASLLAFD